MLSNRRFRSGQPLKEPNHLTRESTRALRTLAGAIIVVTIVGCGLSLSIALLAIRLDAAGYSARAIGLSTAAGGIATLSSAPLIPWAARKLGVSRLLLLALLLGGSALLGFTLTNDYTSWLVLRFVIGISVTILFVMSEFWITSWSPSGHGGLAIGVYVTMLAMGFAVGPLILAVVGTAGQMPFILGACLFFAAALPLMANARDAPPLLDKSRVKLLSFLALAPAATFAGLLHGAIEVAGLSLLPVYALRSGDSAAQGALLACLFVIGNSVLQLPLGLLADRMDRARLLVGLAAVGLVGAVVLALLGDTNHMVFGIILLMWGGVVGALYPVGLGLLGARFAGADLAGANAAFVMTYASGMLFGPPLIGAALDYAPSGFFWAIAGMIAVYLLVALSRPNRHIDLP